MQRDRKLALDWIANKLGRGAIWGKEIPDLFTAYLENFATDLEVAIFLL